MLKLISILGFIFALNTFVHGQQALIDIPLTAVNGPYSQVLTVGGDSTATNGIDAGLGENILPPPPPAGTFDIRFDLNTLRHISRNVERLQVLSGISNYRHTSAYTCLATCNRYYNTGNKLRTSIRRINEYTGWVRRFNL